MGFIEINGRILDLQEHKENVSALRFELFYELNELFSKYGFEVKKKDVRGYGLLCMHLENENLGLGIKIRMDKNNLKKYTKCIKK